MRVDRKSDARRAEELFYLPEVLRAVRAEIIQNDGRPCGDRRTALVFAVQNAQRILFKPLAAVLAHLVKIRGKICLQRFVERLAAGFTADGIEIQLQLLHAQAVQIRAGEQNDLRVRGRCGRAEELHPELVEFPEPPRLRPLVAETGRDIVQLDGQRAAGQILHEAARHSRRAFRLQGDAAPALVFKGVHLFVDDVGGVADAAQKDLRVRERGRADLLEAIRLRDRARGLFQILPLPALRRENVLCPLRDIVHRKPLTKCISSSLFPSPFPTGPRRSACR